MLKTLCFRHDPQKSILPTKDGMDAKMKGKARTRKGFRKKEEQQNDDVLAVHIE